MARSEFSEAGERSRSGRSYLAKAASLAIAVIALMLTAGPAMANDQYEPNEGYFQATDLFSAGTSISAEIDKPDTSESDFDYYSFYVGKASNPVNVTATSSDSSAPLFVRLLNGSGFSYGEDRKMLPTGMISENLPPGEYFMLVADFEEDSFWTGLVPYTLDVTGDLISAGEFADQCRKAEATFEGSEGAMKKAGKQIKQAKKAIKKSKNKVNKAKNRKLKQKAKKALSKAKKSLKKGKSKKKRAGKAFKSAEEFVGACRG